MPTAKKSPIINHRHLRVAKNGKWELYHHKTGATAGQFQTFDEADAAWAAKWRESYRLAGVPLPPVVGFDNAAAADVSEAA